MKHTIHFKLPKLFGRKKKEGETEVQTEVNLETKETYIIIGSAVALGLTVGYLIGHHRGANKKLPHVLVIK